MTKKMYLEQKPVKNNAKIDFYSKSENIEVSILAHRSMGNRQNE